MALLKRTFSELLDFTRATTATFVGSNGLIQTAAIDAPRFTHDPVTLEGQGLLIEEARTNLINYSEQFNNAAWAKSAVSVTANDTNAPNGTATADKLSETVNEAQHFLEQLGLPTSAGAYVQSVFLKAGTLTNCTLSVVHIGESVNTSSVNIDISLGTISGPTNLIISTGITELANGWFRASITYELAGAATSVRMRVFAGNPSFRVGDPLNFIYIWGAQSEEGSFPTSYTPTTSAQVTRAVDSCLRVLENEYNANNFTVFINYKIGEGVISGNLSSIRLFGFSDGTNNSRLSLSVSILLIVNAGNAQNFNLTESLTKSGKVAIAYNGTTISVFLNGSIIYSNLLAANFSFDRMFVGASQFTNAGKVTIKRQELYPKALSEDELITLTGGA